MRVSNTGDQVCCTGPGSGKADTYLGRSPAVTLRRMDRPLLMPSKDMLELVFITIKRIIYWHNRPTGITKNRIHSFLEERFYYRFRALNGLSFGFFRFYCCRAHIIHQLRTLRMRWILILHIYKGYRFVFSKAAPASYFCAPVILLHSSQHQWSYSRRRF